MKSVSEQWSTLFFQAISKHRKEFFENYGKVIDFHGNRRDRTCVDAYFRRYHSDLSLSLEARAAIQVIVKYTTRYEGLDKILCIIDAWARSSGLLSDPSEIKKGMAGE